MPFMSHLINYDFTLVLLQHSGFHNLSFHNFIFKIPQCHTLCLYTPLQLHVLYILLGRGVTLGLLNSFDEYFLIYEYFEKVYNTINFKCKNEIFFFNSHLSQIGHKAVTK